MIRYIEPSSGPASIAVEQRKLLAELDYSVDQFESALTMKVNGVVQKSSYGFAVEARDRLERGGLLDTNQIT